MRRRDLFRTASMLLAVTLIGSAPQLQAKGNTDNLPATLEVAGQPLMLNGAGLRNVLVVKVYAAGLYLPAKSTDAAAIIAADEPQAIHLDVLSDRLDSEKMAEALIKGFDNATDGNTAPIQADIDTLVSTLKARTIKPGQTITLAWVPGSGVEVSENGEPLGTMGDLAFKQALFGIWLSDKPAQQKLKKGLLGG